MYLRRNRRRKSGEDYDYWTLVESVRTARGPRQRNVAHIGKEPGLFEHLRQRYASWFGSSVEFLIYDITSTYFEGQMLGNRQAQRGYSRDQRPDCKQVCIGLVVTTEGLPLAYEVFDGNRADVSTVEEMVDVMEQLYGVADRIWVLDRGMISEETSITCAKRMPATLWARPKASSSALSASCSNSPIGARCRIACAKSSSRSTRVYASGPRGPSGWSGASAGGWAATPWSRGSFRYG